MKCGLSRAGFRQLRLLVTGLVLGIFGAIGPATSAGGQQEFLISQSFTGDIQIYVDVVSYKNLQDPSQTYVEIYYAIDRRQMKFIVLPNTPGVLSAAWRLETVVETEIGDRVTWNQWSTVSQEGTQEATERNQTVFDIYPLVLKPGTYRFITTVTDFNTTLEGDTKIGQDRRTVVIPDFSSPQLTISDIEFTVRLGKAASQNKFVKNDLQVIPNPLRLFGLNIHPMSFYAEIYGLSEPAGPGETARSYTRTVTIEGLNVDFRKVFEDRASKQIRSRNELIAISNLNVQVIPSGDYRLIVEIVDEVTGQRAMRSKPFQVFSQVAAVEADELETIEMTDEAIIRLRNEIIYLANVDELNDFDNRNPDGKREFLIEFWGSRDTNRSTPQNEYREAFLARFKHANDNFATPTQPEGWKTDQGRIWIVYGKPDDIEMHPMEGGQGSKPWVEWTYFQLGEQGRSTFIFYDTSGGFGSYVLLHSTVPGEMQNPDWRNVVGIPPR